MEYITTGFYLLLFIWLVLKLPFFRDNFVSKPYIVGAFVLKVAGGWFFIWLNNVYYFNSGDAVTYFKAGKLIYNTLFEDPLFFLELTFFPNARIPPQHLNEIIDTIPSWSDVRSYTAIRFNALAHLVSFHVYPTHALFGTFMSFTGLMALYKTFTAYFPKRAIWVFGCCFCVPSVVFWTSGLHKDGISMLFTGLMVWNAYLLIEKGFKTRRIAALLMNGVLLLLIRPYTLGLLVPALMLWYIATKIRPLRPLLFYSGAYVFGYAALSLLSLVSQKLNVFAKLAEVRYYFVIYKLGGSDIPLSLLDPTWQAFLTELPRALVNALMRPEPWGNIDLMQKIASAETLVFSLFALFCLVFNNLRQQPYRYFLYACLFFVLTSLMLIGLTTDNLGAIVRYRSNLLPFWLSFWGIVLQLPDKWMRFGKKTPKNELQTNPADHSS